MHFLDQCTQFYFTKHMHKCLGTFNANMCSLYLYIINTEHLIGESNWVQCTCTHSRHQ